MSYKDKEFLTGKEFREMMQISQATLNRWIKAGKIKVFRTAPNSPVRIPTAEIDRLLQENGIETEK